MPWETSGRLLKIISRKNEENPGGISNGHLWGVSEGIPGEISWEIPERTPGYTSGEKLRTNSCTISQAVRGSHVEIFDNQSPVAVLRGITVEISEIKEIL